MRGIPVAFATTLAASALTGAASAGNGATWFINGRPAPPVITATVGRDLATGPNFVLSVTVRHRPVKEPIDGISCLYSGGGLKGGPPHFNDCGKLPGVDICNRKPTTSAESSGEQYGCLLPGAPSKAGTFHFRLFTYWTDFTKDPSGKTMGYDIHRFTVVVHEPSG